MLVHDRAKLPTSMGQPNSNRLPLPLRPRKDQKRSLTSAFLQLKRELRDIDKRIISGAPFSDLENELVDLHEVERRAAIEALDHICRFLASQHAPSRALLSLSLDLMQLAAGRLPATFVPRKEPGRKSDSPHVISLKARLAGLAFSYMRSGSSRDDAARLIIRKLPRPLGAVLSGKPGGVTASMIHAWMERFGATRKTRRELESIRFEEEFLAFMKQVLREIGPDRLGVGYCLRILWLACVGAPLDLLFDIAIKDQAQFLNFVLYGRGSQLFQGERDEDFGFLSREYPVRARLSRRSRPQKSAKRKASGA